MVYTGVEKQIRGLGGSLEPPGLLPMHLHTVYMEYSECLPTLLNPWLRGPVSPRCTPTSGRVRGPTGRTTRSAPTAARARPTARGRSATATPGSTRAPPTPVSLEQFSAV
jgi:hypothetical protein